MSEPNATEVEEPLAQSTLREFCLYFLKLGTFGFGGPIALAGYMERDLVEERRWISRQDYLEGLALAQLAPGPLAAQLAMYLGWVRAGVAGATLVAIAFVLPSFLMVVALAVSYVELNGLSWMQGAFYGIGAAVIGIIARSAFKLMKISLEKDKLLWALFAVSAGVTAWTESEIVWIFVASGVVAMLVRAPPWKARVSSQAWPLILLSGIHGPATLSTLGGLFVYFAAAGTFVFGSGLAIVPFLYGGVVQQYHWLDDRQFLDAVAVAMITPGPVVITVGFIGYLVGGFGGAVLAAAGTFLPCYLFTVLPAPYYRRFAQNRQIKSFVGGVTAAATGAIAGAAFVLGKRALVDAWTIALAVITLAILMRTKKIPEPLLILAAGVAGFVIKAL